MIKTNDLRLNNLVKWNDSVQKITAIAFGNCLLDKNPTADYPVKITEIEPIKLTEEWIKKAGFKEIKFLNEYHVQEKGYKYLDMIIRYGVFDGHRFLFDFANGKCVNLKYVHQLQNLYFSITGEELVFSTEP